MNFRTTLFMLGLLLAVGALVYYGSKGGGSEGINRKRTWVFANEKGDAAADSFGVKISHMEVQQGGQSIVFERDEKKDWKITSPIQEMASSADIDRIKDTIDMDTTRVEEAFAPGDPKINLKEWGLDDSATLLTVKGEGFEHTLRIGALTANKKGCFLQADKDPLIFTVPESIHSSICDKKLADFRNKNLFKFDSFAVDRATVSQGGQDVEVAYQDNKWKIVRPVADQADAEVMNEVLKTASGLQAKEFIEDGATEFKKYGLDVPSLKVGIVPRGEATTQTLLLGGPKEGDKTKVYARRENSPNVVTVEANEVEKLMRTLDDLRDKKVFDFDDNEIVKVTFSRIAKTPPAIGGKMVDAIYRGMGYVRREEFVSLDKPSDSSGWSMEAPTAYPFDLMSVSTWIADLKKEKVVAFRDNEKLDGPPYFRGSEAELWLTLEKHPFGTSVNRRLIYPILPIDANQCVTWRPGDERVLAIGSNLRTQLLRGPLNFRRRSALQMDKAQVVDLTLQRSKEDAVKLQRDPGPPEAWRVLAPANGTVDEHALDLVLQRLGALVVKEYVEDGAGNDVSYGFNDPTVSITLNYGSAMNEGEEGPNNAHKVTVIVGSKGENGYAARYEEEGVPFTPVVVHLDEATVTDLTKKVLR